MTDTNKIKKLAKLATPGPWYATWEEGDDIAWSNLFPVIRADNGEVVIGNEGFYSDLEQDKANATFCAAANPRAVLDLLDENDRLKEENEALREALSQISNASCSDARSVVIARTVLTKGATK